MINFSKLQEAYSLLGILESDKSVAPMVKEIKRLVNEFMVDNEPAPKKDEFNIWRYVSTDDIRIVMSGVYHDKEKQMAIATDAHILVVDKASYDESKVEPEGRRFPIDRYGKFIEANFPTWEKVVPEKAAAIEKGYQQYHVDIKDLGKYVSRCNAYMKLNGYTGKHAKTPVYNVPNSEVWLRADYLRKFLIASGGEIWLLNSDPSRAATVYWSDERIALLMPIMVNDMKAITYEDDLYMLND